MLHLNQFGKSPIARAYIIVGRLSRWIPSQTSVIGQQWTRHDSLDLVAFLAWLIAIIPEINQLVRAIRTFRPCIE